MSAVALIPALTISLGLSLVECYTFRGQWRKTGL